MYYTTYNYSHLLFLYLSAYFIVGFLILGRIFKTPSYDEFHAFWRLFRLDVSRRNLDPLRFPAEWRKRQLNQAHFVLFISLDVFLNMLCAVY